MSHAKDFISTRRVSRPIHVGDVTIGGTAPISVQSMTNTDTRDVAATVQQVRALQEAGADIVRISLPDQASVDAFREIKHLVGRYPLIVDIHYDYRLALAAIEAGADGLRLNPGNIGSRDRVEKVVRSAKARHIPIRIGVNAGSLEKNILKQYGEPTAEALVASALYHIAIFQDLGFDDFKVSLKSSSVGMTVAAYRQLATRIEQPLHLGITEAGSAKTGAVKSAVGLGILLAEGIGDTLRVSLAADPVEEIRVGFDILKSLGLRTRGVNLIACPTCARQEFDVIQTVQALEKCFQNIRESIDVAVIGCIVNGPGEAKQAEVGLTGGSPCLLYVDGLPQQKIAKESVIDLLEQTVKARLATRNHQEISS